MAVQDNLQGKYGLYTLNTSDPVRDFGSLQYFCRKAILKALTIQRMQEVVKLPLPPAIKKYLCTFNIPGDFDMEGLYMDYHSCYPHHLHHYTHQVYPGTYTLDGSLVLLKSQNIKEICGMCIAAGKGKPSGVNNMWRHWISLSHENLLQCHMGLFDADRQRLCFVLEFPGISLLDVMTRMFNMQKSVPEHAVWQVLLKVSSVLMYLQENGIIPWELVRPENVCITQSGEIKLETLLLYLPATSGPLFELIQSPEQEKGQNAGSSTSVWGLGTILHELTMPVPRVLRKDGLFSRALLYNSWVCSNPYSGISVDLAATIMDCLKPCPQERPSLQELNERAASKLMHERDFNMWDVLKS